MDNNWSKRLREVRKVEGLSQDAFAEIVGISPQTYLRYEKGEREPKLSLLQTLAHKGISVEWLLTGLGDIHTPVREEVARLEALVKYWEAKSKLLSTSASDLRYRLAKRLEKEDLDDVYQGLEVDPQEQDPEQLRKRLSIFIRESLLESKRRGQDDDIHE